MISDEMDFCESHRRRVFSTTDASKRTPPRCVAYHGIVSPCQLRNFPVSSGFNLSINATIPAALSFGSSGASGTAPPRVPMSVRIHPGSTAITIASWTPG